MRGYAVRLRAQTKLARRLRQNATEVENRLWQALRELRTGHRLRRQHPIGPYVLDFYCAKAQLSVEIDGMAHEVGDRPQRDQRRDAFLEARGMAIVRIPAANVLAALDDAADGIVRMAAALIEDRGAAPSTALRAVPLPRSREGG